MKDETRKAPLITALEQRILLDAAGALTGAELLEDDGADKDASIAEAEALAPQTRERREVAFVDGGLEDVETLIADLPENTEVVVIDPAQDGFKAMAAYLDGHSDVDAVHVFGHGAAGQATLGTATLDASKLDAYTDELRRIGDALTEAGDILFYGCYVGAGPEGEALVEDIVALTAADVAASDDLTGAAELGGDWELEVSAGAVEAESFVSKGFSDVLSGAPPGSVSFDVVIDGEGHTSTGNTTITVDYGTATTGFDKVDFSDGNGVKQLSSNADTFVTEGGSSSDGRNMDITFSNGVNMDWVRRMSVVFRFEGAGDGVTAPQSTSGGAGSLITLGTDSATTDADLSTASSAGPFGPTIKPDGTVTNYSVWVYVVEWKPDNEPPSAGSGSTITVNEGGIVNLTKGNTGSSDPDGDALTFSPGAISVSSDPSKKGTISIGSRTFTVTDAEGETDTGSVNVQVVYADDPTVWNSSPSGTTWSTSGERSYSWANGASDPDDSVSYSYVSGKESWMSASGSSPITGNPGVSQHGDTETINVKATGSTTVNRSFNISVSGSSTTDVDGNSVTGGSLNDAPDVQTSASDDIVLDEDSHHDFSAALFEGFFSDPDAGSLYNSLHSLLLLQQPDHGRLLYDNGSGYELIEPGGNPLAPSNPFRIAKADIGKLRYKPDADFNGNDEFIFKLSDGLADPVGASTLDITVDPVNDAPVLNAAGGADFTTITEDDVLASDETTANIGNTVAHLLAGQVSDLDAEQTSTENQNVNGADNGKELGMAIYDEFIAGPGDGVWEYWIDDGTSGYTDDANWNSLTAQGALTVNDALLLGPDDRLRFNPDSERGNGGEPTSSDYYDANDADGDTSIAEQVPNPAAKSSLTYYAWDGSGGFGLNINGERRADVTTRDSGDGSSTSPFSASGDTTGIAVEDRNDDPNLSGISVGGGDRFNLGLSGTRGTDASDAQYGITDAEFVDYNNDPGATPASLTDPDKNDDTDNGLTEIDYAGYRVEIARQAPNGSSTGDSWERLNDRNVDYDDDSLGGSPVDQFGFDPTFVNMQAGINLTYVGSNPAKASVGDTIKNNGQVVAEVLSSGDSYFELEFRNTGAGTGAEVRATQTVVDAILQSITYRADKPYGDARFKMTVKDVPYPYSTDGDSNTMDVRATDVGIFDVRSESIFVTQVDETGTPEVTSITTEADAKGADIDSADGITLREAVIIAERQGDDRIIHLHGTHTITDDLLIESTTGSGIDEITLQLDGDTTLNVADGTSVTIDAKLIGKGTLTKTGDGTLILNGDNAFGEGTPDITVAKGTLAGHAEALGGTASNTIDVQAGARLLIVQGDDSAVEGGPSGVTDQDDATLGATLSGSGVIEKTGDDLLTLNTTTTDHDGIFIVNEGRVKASATGALGAQSTIEIHGGDGLSSAGGSLEIAASQTTGELRSDHTADGDNALLTIADGAILTVNQTTDSTFTGKISGDGGLVKTGGGTLTLDNFGVDTSGDAPPIEAAGESDYKGDTSVEAGMLVATGHSIGDLSSVVVQGGATLRITGDEEIGSLTSVENANGEAVVEIDDDDGTEEPGTPTLTTGGNDEDTTFAGQIGGEGGLTKTGSGGMTLDTTGDTDDPGGNTFSGPLTVEEGDVTTKGGKSIGDGTPVEVIDPGRLNVDDSEEVGSLNGDGDINIGGDTEIGQGVTARLEARLRPQVEDAVNVGDRIEYKLTMENTSSSNISIDGVGNDLGVDFAEGGSAFADDAPFIVEPGVTKVRTLTAFYTLTEADLRGSAPSPISIKVTLDPDDEPGDDITPIELAESTELTPNTPSDVLTVGGNDPGVDPDYENGDGGSFGGTTSGPGGLDVTAPGGLTVEGPKAGGGELGHDGGTVVGNGGGLTNKGKISGEGDITVEGGDDGTDPETPGGTFVNEGTITDGDGDPTSDGGDGGDVNVLGPNGDFDNEPTGEVEGDVDNDGGTVTNGGTIGGDVGNSGEGGSFTNEDGGTIEGDVDNDDGGTFDNQDGGTIKGDVTTDGGGVTNGGIVEGGVTVTGGGSFDNEDGGTVEGDAEVDDGTFDNEGAVEGDVTYIPPSGNVTGDGEIKGTVSPEEFIVDLHGTIDPGADNKINAGDTITYTMTVTNKTIEELDFANGTIDLLNAEVFDPSLVGFKGFTNVSRADGDTLFAEGETWVYSATVTLGQAAFDTNGTADDGSGDDDGDIDQFVHVEATSVDGKVFSGSDVTATALRADLDVAVRQIGTLVDVDGDGFATKADRIDYVTTVRNTGNLAIKPGTPGFEITAPVSLDDLSPRSSFDDGDDRLLSGEVWTYAHRYQLTDQDFLGTSVDGGASFAGTDTLGTQSVMDTAASSVALEIADAPASRSVIDPKSDTSETARLTVGGLVMEPDGVGKFDLAGTDPEAVASAGGHDQIRISSSSVNPSLRLNGAELSVNLLDGNAGEKPFIPQRGDVFLLIDNNANVAIDGKFSYSENNDRGRFTEGTDNDVLINTKGDARGLVEEGDILRFDGYDFRVSYIGDADANGSTDAGFGAHDLTLTRVNMRPEVLADVADRYDDGQTARLHSYPIGDRIDGKDLAPADRASSSTEAAYDAESAGLTTIDFDAEGHAIGIDLAARNTHSDFEVIAEAGEDNQGTLATKDIVNLPFKVSGTLGLYDPDASDSLALAGEESDGTALTQENGVTGVRVEHYVSTEDANGNANLLSGDPRQPSEAILRALFTASVSATNANSIQGDFSGAPQQAATATVNWTFDASREAAAAFDYLDKGEVLDITYTIRVTDSQKVIWDVAREAVDETDAYTEHAVTIRVIGTNDPVKVLVDDKGELPNVDHLWQFGRDYLDNDEGRKLNVFTLSTEGRETVTPLSDGDRIYDVSRLFVDRDVTEDADVARAFLDRGNPKGLAERDGVTENLFFTITSTKSSTGEIIKGPTPEEMFETKSDGSPLWGQLRSEFAAGTVEGMLPGLVLDMDTGVISGRPIDVGTYIIEVTAIDSSGAIATRSFEILVVGPPSAQVAVPQRAVPEIPRPATDVEAPELERGLLPPGTFAAFGLSADIVNSAGVLEESGTGLDAASDREYSPRTDSDFEVFVRANGEVVFALNEPELGALDSRVFEAEVVRDDLFIELADRLLPQVDALEVRDVATGQFLDDIDVDPVTGRFTIRGISARDIETVEVVIRYEDGREMRFDIRIDFGAYELQSALPTQAGSLQENRTLQAAARREVASIRATGAPYEAMLAQL